MLLHSAENHLRFCTFHSWWSLMPQRPHHGSMSTLTSSPPPSLVWLGSPSLLAPPETGCFNWGEGGCSSWPGCPLMAKDRGRLEGLPLSPPFCFIPSQTGLLLQTHTSAHYTPHTHRHAYTHAHRRFSLNWVLQCVQSKDWDENMRRILQGEFDFHIIFTHVQKQTGYMCVTCHMCTLNVYVCRLTDISVCIKEYLLITKDLKSVKVQPLFISLCVVCVVCSCTCWLVLRLTLNWVWVRVRVNACLGEAVSQWESS